MAHDDRDQRGGHRRRKSDWLSCGCCPNLTKNSRGRRRRNRELDRFERRANGTD
ncbi:MULTISPECIES: hypothetical protein [unclassified Microbacterium]|uniref:hypothetical protein n=1 Tax=unclassified Microbacterium TaxID=2609290 RepID=UPI002882ED4F|nr:MULTISPECIES: hypothetical protein [unclassified Microbacterium]